ncbi:response regulator [bacterium]|nr:response regulator [bacterium]
MKRLDTETRSNSYDSANQNTTRSNEHRRSSRTILLIDDDDLVAQTLSMMLSTSNYDVRIANNGLDALKIFKNEPIGLVISDLMMPSISGWDVVESIRQMSQNVPVFIITGYLNELLDKQKERVESLGINEILLKPVHMNDLIDKVAPYVGRKEMRASCNTQPSPPISPFL